MDAHCRAIMDEYRSSKDSFEKMKDVVMAALKGAVKENGMLIAVMEARVKEEKSLAGKLELKGYKYRELSDITDILGARVVVFYSDEVDKIAALVEKNFEVDREDSVDKRKILASDQFGYLSLHYICRVPEKLYKDPEHPEINKYRFEIQIRTVLQHAWATAYHDTGYKSDIEVPKKYIRSLSRLAGLLELADEEFSANLREIEDYRRRVRSLIHDGNFEDLELNGDTWKRYLEISPFDALNERIAAINRAEIFEQNLEAYLPVLVKLGMKTLGDIEKMKQDCGEDAYKLALLQIGGTDLDILASNVGLQNLCIVHCLKQGGGEADLKMIFDSITGERESNRNTAKRLMEQAKSLEII